MNIILIGPQGSGKGTQARLLLTNYQLKHIEMGEILREEAKEPTKRGQLINTLINERGKLLPNGIVFEIFKEINQQQPTPPGYLFDGYPRTVSQFNLLEDYLVEKNQFIHLAIYLTISEQTAIDRLSNRVICIKCKKLYNLKTNPPPPDHICECGGKIIRRPDDEPEIIKERMQLFEHSTQPVVNLLREKGILFTVDASQAIDAIFNEIKSEISRKNLQ